MVKTRVMLKTVFTLTALLAIVPLFAQAKHKPARMTDEQTILALDDKWSQTAGAHDLKGTIAFYADDAVLLFPNAVTITNKKDFAPAWAPLTAATSTVSWKATKVEVARSHDIAYSYGTYQLTMKDAHGKTIADHGKFLEIWKKRHGKWICVVDTFNTDLP
ncbi:MAG: nuclear transport factor 2 family protein [Armatimonadetes bacterium]|nr:nuclear transport factor 2 family protein [Armatimonadota bacterium]